MLHSVSGAVLQSGSEAVLQSVSRAVLQSVSGVVLQSVSKAVQWKQVHEVSVWYMYVSGRVQASEAGARGFCNVHRQRCRYKIFRPSAS